MNGIKHIVLLSEKFLFNEKGITQAEAESVELVIIMAMSQFRAFYQEQLYKTF